MKWIMKNHLLSTKSWSLVIGLLSSRFTFSDLKLIVQSHLVRLCGKQKTFHYKNRIIQIAQELWTVEVLVLLIVTRLAGANTVALESVARKEERLMAAKNQKESTMWQLVSMLIIVIMLMF